MGASDVTSELAQLYGPFTWEPRYDAASELVFTILSQHTSDINSERAFLNLMATFRSVEAVADADVADIERAIRSAGLSKTKAPRIKEVLGLVREKLGDFDLTFLAEMPLADAKAWLKDLPGIGPKTAAIILCFSLGLPAMPVDTHIYRVAQRVGLIGPKVNVDKAHDLLEPMVPPEEVFAFHLYLINHGRKVCKAIRPRCSDCTLGWGCKARPKFEREEQARVAKAEKKAASNKKTTGKKKAVRRKTSA
jgi:endonuclease III